MAMGIAVVQGLVEGTGQFIQGFKALAFESQGTQSLPRGLDQIKPASVFCNEQKLDFGPNCQSQFDLAREMNIEHLIQHQSVYTVTLWYGYSACMLSEQPGKEMPGNPESEIDPDQPMIYQISVKLHSAA